MTRTTDDLHPEPPFKPWGEKVVPQTAPAPAPKPIAPGVLQGPDGRLRTDLPLPKG